MAEVRAASVSKRVFIRLSDHQKIGVQDITRPRNQDTGQLALQLSRILYKSALFLQNKANFRKGEMTVSSYNTKEYENLRICRLGKSKAKQSQLKPNPMLRWASFSGINEQNH